MCFFSPFEESAICSYGWLCSQLFNTYLFVFSNLIIDIDYYYYEYVLDFSFLLFDAIDFVYSSFFMFLDNNYTLVLFIICTYFSFFCFKRTMRKQNKLSYVLLNSVSEFVYKHMVLSYLGADGKRYFSFFIFLFYFILFGNLLGLVPSFFPITSHLSVTLLLSSIS